MGYKEYTQEELWDNEISGRIFRGDNFGDATINTMVFSNCQFLDCVFDDTRWHNVEFNSCLFKGCSFNGTEMGISSFEQCEIDSASFNGAIFRGFRIFNTSITSADFVNLREFDVDWTGGSHQIQSSDFIGLDEKATSKFPLDAVTMNNVVFTKCEFSTQSRANRFIEKGAILKSPIIKDVSKMGLKYSVTWNWSTLLEEVVGVSNQFVEDAFAKLNDTMWYFDAKNSELKSSSGDKMEVVVPLFIYQPEYAHESELVLPPVFIKTVKSEVEKSVLLADVGASVELKLDIDDNDGTLTFTYLNDGKLNVNIKSADSAFIKQAYLAGYRAGLRSLR